MRCYPPCKEHMHGCRDIQTYCKSTVKPALATYNNFLSIMTNFSPWKSINYCTFCQENNICVLLNSWKTGWSFHEQFRKIHWKKVENTKTIISTSCSNTYGHARTVQLDYFGKCWRFYNVSITIPIFWVAWAFIRSITVKYVLFCTERQIQCIHVAWLGLLFWSFWYLT